MSFSSRPGNSAVISISLSVSLRSIVGISSRDGNPAKLREKPSNKRSISCCRAENGLDAERVKPRSLPTGINEFNTMVDPPDWQTFEPSRLIEITAYLRRESLIEVKAGWLA